MPSQCRNQDHPSFLLMVCSQPPRRVPDLSFKTTGACRPGSIRLHHRHGCTKHPSHQGICATYHARLWLVVISVIMCTQFLGALSSTARCGAAQHAACQECLDACVCQLCALLLQLLQLPLLYLCVDCGGLLAGAGWSRSCPRSALRPEAKPHDLVLQHVQGHTRGRNSPRHC